MLDTDRQHGVVPQPGGARSHGVFISYRHADTGPTAGRLGEALRDQYGADRVFRDFDSNRPAVDYVRQVTTALASAQVALAVIGPRWLEPGPDGVARLHEPLDLVRAELAQALKSGITLVPVLIDDAYMPAERDLPDELRPLARLHAERLRLRDWAYDLQRLFDVLATHGVLPQAGEKPGVSDKTWAKDVQRFERTVRTTRTGAYNAIYAAVVGLHYPLVSEASDAALLRFTAASRTVTAMAVDTDRPGHTCVKLEFAKLSLSAIASGGGAAAFLLGPVAALGAVAAGFYLAKYDRRFAAGFLDNVQRVLDGKHVGDDSAIPPGVGWFRKGSQQV